MSLFVYKISESRLSAPTRYYRTWKESVRLEIVFFY